MAISVTMTLPAEAVCCFERPKYIGGTRSQVIVMSDFDDCFDQIIIGTHPDGYVVQSGDYLQFQIFPEASAAATFRSGIDFKFIAGPYLSDDLTLDVNGVSVADGDRSPYLGQWRQITASLEAFVGLTLDQIIVHFEEDAQDLYVLRFRQIVITNAGAVTKQIYVGQSSGLPSNVAGIFLTNAESHLVNNLEEVGQTYGEPVVVSSGTSYSVSAYEQVVINNSGAGAMTFNLPDAGLLPTGKWYIFTNAHATNNLTIDPFSTQTIDGSTTKVLTPGQSTEIIKYSSTAWLHLGGV